jgi:hypothetical protein
MILATHSIASLNFSILAGNLLRGNGGVVHTRTHNIARAGAIEKQRKRREKGDIGRKGEKVRE